MLVGTRMLSLCLWPALRMIAVGLALSVVAFVSPGQVTAVSAAAGVTTLVSVSNAGGPGNRQSQDAVISADGRYVAFTSGASNLVPADTNGSFDVFVRDRQAGTTRRVSVAGTGRQGNSHSGGTAISSDGRYIAFSSDATNLVPGDTNQVADIFLRDMQAGTTRRVNLSNTGTQSPGEVGGSSAAAISDDGRYVTFWSAANSLVPGDTNFYQEIFRRDMQAGTTRQVVMSSAGVQGNDETAPGNAISADGRYVTFASGATNLVDGDTNGTIDVFRRDMQAGLTQRISISSTGAQANAGSNDPSISANGRYITFTSAATNLADGDTNSTTDVFRRDMQAGLTQRISISSTGAQADNYSLAAAVSPGGRYVAFLSAATNLVPGEANLHDHVYLRDVQTGTTRRISVTSAGEQARQSSESPAISSGGQYVTFASFADNLTPGDTNGTTDVFVRTT